MMRFVLEESSWSWDGNDRDDYIERIEQLFDRLDVACERDEPFAASSELLEQRVHGDISLADLLWGDLSLPREVTERATAHFGRMSYWDDTDDWPAIEVRIGEREVLSPSAALTCQHVSQGQAMACIPLPGSWTGPHVVTIDDDTHGLVHFVTDEASHRAFFRDAIDVERVDESGLEALAPHAFPDIFFLEGVWDGMRHFEGGYARVRDRLHRFFAVLDDHGAWAFTDDTGRLSPDEPVPSDGKSIPATNQIVEKRFSGCGVTVAPENPNVKNDGDCRRARERELDGCPLYCEWHYKIERHTNRVHIHPPVPESKHKIIVAIMRDHLPLPGDRH